MKRLFLAAGLFCLLALPGCDSPQRTVDTLQKEIAEYKAAPSDQKQIEIEKNLTRLEEQILNLEKKGDARARELKDQLSSLRSDYKAAKMARALQDAKNALQGFSEVIKDGAKTIQEAFKDSQTNN